VLASSDMFLVRHYAGDVAYEVCDHMAILGWSTHFVRGSSSGDIIQEQFL